MHGSVKAWRFVSIFYISLRPHCKQQWAPAVRYYIVQCVILSKSQPYPDDSNYDVKEFKYGQETGSNTETNLTADFTCGEKKIWSS